MKNSNTIIIGAVPMVTMAQSAAHWHNAHTCGSHVFTHTPTSTQLQPHCAKRQLS